MWVTSVNRESCPVLSCGQLILVSVRRFAAFWCALRRRHTGAASVPGFVLFKALHRAEQPAGPRRGLTLPQACYKGRPSDTRGQTFVLSPEPFRSKKHIAPVARTPCAPLRTTYVVARVYYCKRTARTTVSETPGGSEAGTTPSVRQSSGVSRQHRPRML